MSGPVVVSVSEPGGAPVDPAIVAVIAAAVDQTWPRPSASADEAPTGPPAWRFSGRWWRAPITARRDRPHAF